MKSILFRTLLLQVFVAVPLGRADVSVAPLFTDHAVLQRGKPIPVWGDAAPGEEITVTFRDVQSSTIAGTNGKWRVELPAQEPGEASEFVIAGTNRIVLRDVVVGDVWLCSGQSNMAFTVEKTDNAAEVIAEANAPLIRQFRVAITAKKAPADQVGGTWELCSPKTVGRFTAVGYFFAQKIQSSIGVPVGIINSSVGGTPVEAWMSAEAFATLPTAFEEVARTAATPKGKKTNQRRLPKVLYNGMIAPLVPYALRGMLWYQGEGNANAVFPEMTENYAQNFQTLITDWRRVFGQGDLPFYFVQLPNFRTGNPDSGIWPRVRAAQEQALRLPATGMAVTIDVGDPRDIHPRNKKVVGERLALVALKHTYQKDVVANGPTLIGHRVHRNRVKLRFDQTVQLKPGSDPAFEIAGPDGAFTPARAAARNNEVHLVNDSVEQPVFVRYAWSNNPTASVFNATGLPAAPFQVKLDERAP